MKPRYKQKINLTIKTLGCNGEGIGYWHGLTFFVDEALPGEVIEARVTERTRRWGRARVSKIVQSSPHRVSPPCPYFERCGGCQLMHLDDSHQLQLKNENVVHAFQKFAGVTELPILPCIGSPQTLHYRNKVQLPAGLENGQCTLGLYAKNSRDLVPIEKCLVHCELGERIFQKIQPLLRQYNVVPFEPLTHSGDLRYVLIKTAVHTNEALVIFVTRTDSSDPWQAIAHHLTNECPEIKGVLQNIHGDPSNTVLGEHQILLYGKEEIEELLCGLRFRFSSKAFFQVNPYQAEQLYKHVLDSAELTGTETVLDAYCGVGTLSLLLAQKAKRVIGVEVVPEAIEDAKQNAQLNHISNTEFLCAATEDVISSLDSMDIVVLNPPRKGCDSRVLEALCQKKPKRILYVSCDPATLARDAAHLMKGNYSIQKIQPFDMFPQTAHVETLAIFKLQELQEV